MCKSNKCKYYDDEYEWCKLKMDWTDSMPIITWCNDDYAKKCKEYKEEYNFNNEMYKQEINDIERDCDQLDRIIIDMTDL